MRTYTFHVSLPGYKRVWRKIELPADATLEGLHFAIQDAYAFNNDHLYSFFMSGKTWDKRSEFTLPEGSNTREEILPLGSQHKTEEYAVEADNDDTEIEVPTAAELRTILEFLQSDPQVRQQFMDTISQEVGVPPAMIDKLINDMQTVAQGMSDDQMNEPLVTEAETVGDVRTTALAALQLSKGQQFLYLFDYGDEWQFKVKVHAINENADPAATYPRLVESVGVAPEQYPDWDEDEGEGEEDETE